MLELRETISKFLIDAILYYLLLNFNQMTREQITLNSASISESLNKVQFINAEKSSENDGTILIGTHDKFRKFYFVELMA
jgi:hypothetical protein